MYFTHSPKTLKSNGKADDRELSTSRVPEPGSLALIGLGIAGLGALRRRQK